MHQSFVYLIVIIAFALEFATAQTPGIEALIAPGAKAGKLADGFGFGEGPAWHPGENALYFSDLKNKTIHRWSADDGVTTVREGKDVFANGIVIDAKGRLVFCETGAFRIVRREKDGSETVLAEEVNGQLLGMTNDLWMTPAGGIYFTLPNKGKKNQKLVKEGRLMGTIVYLSPDGKTTDVGKAVDVKAPNGIVGSSDGKKLFFRDGGQCRVTDIEPDGSLSNAKLAAPKGTDGLTLDEQGNLYTTSKEGVEVFAPGAKRIGLIPIPETPANLTFGGPENRTLFITARTGLYAIEMQVKGDRTRYTPEVYPVQSNSVQGTLEKLDIFLENHCFDCHDDSVSKGDLDLTAIDLSIENYHEWATVFKRVKSNEMPPEDKPRPDSNELASFLENVSDHLASVEQKGRETNGRAVVRRLNRKEYEHTLQDLLALPELDIAESLPPEGSADGFDKSAAALDFSHVHANRLMEVADLAIRKAIAPVAEKPESKIIRFDVKGPENLKESCNGMYALLKQSKAMPLSGMEVDSTIRRVKGNFLKRDPGVATDQAPFFDSLALFINGEFNLGMSIKPFKVSVPGYYKLRVNGFGVLNDHGKLTETDRIETVGFYSNDRTLGYVDLPPYKPTTAELTVWLEPEDVVKPLVASAPNAKLPIPVKAKPGTVVPEEQAAFRKFKSNGVAFRWFELEGPIIEEWPPESHKRLFGDLKIETGRAEPTRRNREPEIYIKDIVPEDAMKDARRLLRSFATRALRRPLQQEVDMKIPMAIVNRKLRRDESFMEAMISGYRAVLTSPDFLLMASSEPGPLDGFAVAERLSLFLWNSSPDTPLLNFARSGRLLEPAVLRSQVERMLNDEKADRFVEHFLDKWLKLEDIALTEPDGNLYPEYTPLLLDSSLWETRAFFTDMLKNNLGAARIAHSDFVMINQRLADLYQIPGVSGNHIRRVSLPKNSVRGGLLTQASVLKTTANGTVTSPVVRGDYVMVHILGDPPPPPPPEVPAVEPDITGATTIREQLARHSADKSCAACHAKIDPPGFALEAFDVMGGFRERYRSLEKGDPIPGLTFEGKPAKTRLALPVDASGEMPDGATFRGIRDFKGILLDREEQLARHLLEQMIVYATGAPVGFSDKKIVDQMMTNLAARDYGVRSMIHEVVQSSLFLQK